MKHSCSWVVDMQCALLAKAHNAVQLTENARELIDRFRSGQMPVVFVQHDSSDYKPMLPGQRGWQSIRNLNHTRLKLVIRKRFADSFEATRLETVLRRMRVSQIMLSD